MKLNLLSAIFALLVLPAAAQTDSLSGQPMHEGPLTSRNSSGRVIHIFPTIEKAKELGLSPIAAGDAGPLSYHGGAVMQQAYVYQIFWIPSKLQSGGATGMSSTYKFLQEAMAEQYIGHPLHDITSQYYQVTTGKQYVHAIGVGYPAYIDTNPYPASGCSDSKTPGNCVTDAQIQAEIERVMTANHWTAAPNKLFMLYTSSGEGSCFDATNTSCAYTEYCAYHSSFGGTIYSNQPFGNPSTCQLSGTPAPNDVDGDTAASTASHELSESITDPFGTAWYTSQGNEIGDLCAYEYGTNTWDGGKANQMWTGVYFELQMEFDNHTGACAQVGP